MVGPIPPILKTPPSAEAAPEEADDSPDEADDAAEEAADPDSAFDPDDELPEPLPQAVIETAISAANERPTNFFMFFIIISS